MLKFAGTTLLIYSLLILSVNTPTRAQTRSGPTSDSAPIEQTAKGKPDLKRVFAEETKKFKTESARFDPGNAEKASRKQTAKTRWTNMEKFGIALAIIGAAALIFVIAKYGKVCIQSTPGGCTPGVDEFCTCEQYGK